MTSGRMPERTVTLFLAGDVMTGRGIDQILPRPGDPRLFEPYVSSALEYVALAERESGPLPRPVGFSYIWGDALAELGRVAPDARIVNLETAVTTSDDAWPGKGIHYRMNPANLPCLTAAGLDHRLCPSFRREQRTPPSLWTKGCFAVPPELDRERWWSWGDSNPRPPACHAGALPAELQPHRRSTHRRGYRAPLRSGLASDVDPTARRASSASPRHRLAPYPARLDLGSAYCSRVNASAGV